MKETLAKGQLCFGCYQLMTETPNVKGCKGRLVCSLCFDLHPTGMHEYIKKTNEDHDNA